MKKFFYRLIWWLYITALFVFIVVKFNGSLSDLLARRELYSESLISSYNLKPFVSIGWMIKYLDQPFAQANLFGNILPFIPFGFLLPKAFKSCGSFFKVFFLGLFSILFIELFQLFTRLGSFDVDDIILNMISIVLGYIMYVLLKRK